MKTNVLVIDDSKLYVESVKQILKNENHNILVSFDGDNMFEILENEKVDVILLDIVLPKIDGFYLLEKIIGNEDTKDIPIIMVTGMTSTETLKKALDMGAFDYIRKPFEGIELIARVNSALRLKAKQDQLRDFAIRDNLTLLFNRGYCDKTLKKAIANINQCENGLSFAMLDIDYFKKVNDTYGHVCGDIVLSIVGQTIYKSVKNSDIVCRYGGEEFCIIFPDTNLEEAVKVCERVRENIKKNKFVFNKADAYATISIGVTHVKPDENKSFLDVITMADKALYSAKSKGRDRVEVWEQQL